MSLRAVCLDHHLRFVSVGEGLPLTVELAMSKAVRPRSQNKEAERGR